jgi:hypothetical protein
MNDIPNIIEEEADPLEENPVLPLNELPAEKNVPEVPPIILGL